MNVLMILTNGFDPDVRVYKEAKYLVNKGYNVEILCWDRDNKYKEKPIEKIDGIKIIRFFAKSKYGSGLKQIFKLLSFKNSCKKYIKKNEIKYDYIHCHDLDGMIIGYFIHKKGDKLIFDMHEYYNTRSYAKIYFIIKRIITFLQNKSYKIIHVNDYQIKSVTKRNKSKLVHLPNYPEKEKFKNIKHINSQKIRITYAGYIRHLIPMKNLINAAKDVKNILISIHGSGDKYDEILNESLNKKNIEITGSFKHDEIIKFYSNSDLIYIVYNKNNKNDETALPTKLFEAIICKIPVIVSKNSAMEDFVKKYDIGFSVDGTNVNDIRKIIIYIEKNREVLKQKIANLEKINNIFFWEEVVKNLDNIYKENN